MDRSKRKQEQKAKSLKSTSKKKSDVQNDYRAKLRPYRPPINPNYIWRYYPTGKTNTMYRSRRKQKQKSKRLKSISKKKSDVQNDYRAKLRPYRSPRNPNSIFRYYPTGKTNTIDGSRWKQEQKTKSLKSISKNKSSVQNGYKTKLRSYRPPRNPKSILRSENSPTDFEIKQRSYRPVKTVKFDLTNLDIIRERSDDYWAKWHRLFKPEDPLTSLDGDRMPSNDIEEANTMNHTDNPDSNEEIDRNFSREDRGVTTTMDNTNNPDFNEQVGNNYNMDDTEVAEIMSNTDNPEFNEQTGRNCPTQESQPTTQLIKTVQEKKPENIQEFVFESVGMKRYVSISDDRISAEEESSPKSRQGVIRPIPIRAIYKELLYGPTTRLETSNEASAFSRVGTGHLFPPPGFIQYSDCPICSIITWQQYVERVQADSTQLIVNPPTPKEIDSTNQDAVNRIDSAVAELLGKGATGGIQLSGMGPDLREEISLKFEEAHRKLREANPDDKSALDEMTYLLHMYPLELIPDSIKNVYLDVDIIHEFLRYLIMRSITKE